MSEYDELLDQCKQHALKLKDLVPRMYEVLKKDGHEPADAKDIVFKDLLKLGWTKDYIRSLLPSEAKDDEKAQAAYRKHQISAESGAEKSMQIEQDDGTVLQMGPDGTAEPDQPHSDTMRSNVHSMQYGRVGISQCPNCKAVLHIMHEDSGEWKLERPSEHVGDI